MRSNPIIAILLIVADFVCKITFRTNRKEL